MLEPVLVRSLQKQPWNDLQLWNRTSLGEVHQNCPKSEYLPPQSASRCPQRIERTWM